MNAIRARVLERKRPGKCYIDGNKVAKNMYDKLGFYLTGERDGDEIVMEKVLR